MSGSWDCLRLLNEIKQQTKFSLKVWPSPQDYNEALQSPEHSFQDPELAAGKAEQDAIGLPRPNSGMFASVYRMNCANTDWAVRCFLQHRPEQIERYIQIEKTLKEAALACTVPFNLQEQGLRIGSNLFPILKMEWCQGEPLNHWLETRLRQKEEIESFLESWRQVLRDLAAAGIAHGDLQHGNILVQDGKIKLVDYDGMYVPAFAGLPASELGHRNYQHPARVGQTFGPFLDNFSAWLIYLSVLTVGCDPHIWHDFEGGDECLIFRQSDLSDPSSSQLFMVLEHHHNPQIRECSRSIRYLLTLKPEEIPNLESPLVLPEDFPELDSVLHDLPDWLATSLESNQNGGFAGADLERIQNEGAAYGAGVSPDVDVEPAASVFTGAGAGTASTRTVYRRRRRGSQQNGTAPNSGYWAYDKSGQLAFNHAPNNTGASGHTSSSHPLKLHSPLLQTGTPSLQTVSGVANSSNSTQSNIFKHQGSRAFQFGLIFWTIVLCIYLFTNHSTTTEKNTWPDGAFHSVSYGNKQIKKGNLSGAEKTFLDGIAELKNSKDARSVISLALMHRDLAKVYLMNNQYEKAEKQYYDALKYFDKYSGKNGDYLECLESLAHTYTTDGKYLQAEGAFKRMLQVYRERDAKNSDAESNDSLSPDRIRCLQDFAQVLQRDGKTDEARQVLHNIPPPAPKKDVQPKFDW